MADPEISDKGAEESGSLKEAKIRFAEFLEANPSCGLTVGKGRDGKDQVKIERPWDDESIAITVPDNPESLAEALRHVFLPERLTALWHSDTKQLEVIWTAYQPSPSQRDIVGRKFDFEFRQHTYLCEFKKSSERLIEIAKNFMPQTMSTTNHRNLISFYNYSKAPDNVRDKFGLDEPRSFWVSDLHWNEGKVLDLLAHLNFYLTYYDDRCPTVSIHPPNSIFIKNHSKVRYIADKFPEHISASEMNENILNFWDNSRGDPPATRFINFYRIIEFASHYFVDYDTRREVMRLLSEPNIREKLPTIVDRITDALGPKRNDEVPKFKGIVNRCVSKKLIWREINLNPDSFTKETKFDGGFTLKALISEKETEEAFAAKNLDQVCDAMRKIRNALAHGRDQETGGVISGTARNFQLLTPWVHLAGTIAGEVALYKDVTI